MKSLLLHAHELGPNPIKIAIACEFLKLPYEIEAWEFGDNHERGVKGTRFLNINENGRVPALDDPNSGITAWESGAIMNYLRRNYDRTGALGPDKSTEQAKVDFDTASASVSGEIPECCQVVESHGGTGRS